MKNISLNIDKTFGFVSKDAIFANEAKIKECSAMLHKATGKGNDFLGWLNLPSSTTDKFLNEIQEVANTLRSKCEVVVVAGIGGSYLGARSVIDALSNSFQWLTPTKDPIIVYAGNSISEDYLAELSEFF